MTVDLRMTEVELLSHKINSTFSLAIGHATIRPRFELWLPSSFWSHHFSWGSLLLLRLATLAH